MNAAEARMNAAEEMMAEIEIIRPTDRSIDGDRVFSITIRNPAGERKKAALVWTVLLDPEATLRAVFDQTRW